jgi:hypothetical protein
MDAAVLSSPPLARICGGKAMQAIHAAERFVKQMEKDPSAVHLTKVDGLLKALAAVSWEDASPRDREIGWGLTLRLALLQHPGRGQGEENAVSQAVPTRSRRPAAHPHPKARSSARPPRT